jgi:hypothetical protein
MMRVVLSEEILADRLGKRLGPAATDSCTTYFDTSRLYRTTFRLFLPRVKLQSIL